jgi:hypothetical protein
MTPKKCGKTLEIDHIISLQLGGSTTSQTCFRRSEMCRPDARSRISSKPAYHDIVCTEHTMTLRQVQKAIAKNWETLHKKVYGEAPHQKVSRAARSAREALTHTARHFGFPCDLLRN